MYCLIGSWANPAAGGARGNRLLFSLSAVVWKILHDGVTYEERRPAVTNARAQSRAAKMIR